MHLMQWLKQVKLWGEALGNLTKKLVTTQAKEEGKNKPLVWWFCCLQFEKLNALSLTPQWVVRTMEILHSALLGIPSMPAARPDSALCQTLPV